MPAQQGVAPPQGFDPDNLSGEWRGQNGSYTLNKSSATEYSVVETGLMGVSGRGHAVRNGNTLDLVVNNALLGRIGIRFEIEIGGDALRGQLNVMGMPMPLIMQRVSGPAAPKPRRIEHAPPDLEKRFNNRMAAASAAAEAGQQQEAQKLYVQALELAMESPEPDDDILAIRHVLLLANHVELTKETVQHCFTCLDALLQNGHGLGDDEVGSAVSLLTAQGEAHLDQEQRRAMAVHGMTMLNSDISPPAQGGVAWAAALAWIGLGEAALARQTIDLVNRAELPAASEEALVKLEQALTAAGA